MKGDCSPVGRLENYLLIISFCPNRWRTIEDIIQYFGIPLRTAQRYVEQLVDRGYLERNGKSIGATKSIHHAFKWCYRLLKTPSN